MAAGALLACKLLAPMQPVTNTDAYLPSALSHSLPVQPARNMEWEYRAACMNVLILISCGKLQVSEVTVLLALVAGVECRGPTR